ncbi:MAG TPA: ABC transporter substrate-binding protein [Trebonia sp.]|jgi:multiple sugar transport system substrate-binding protein
MSMKRAIIAAAAVAIALLLTAGCGPDGAPSGGQAPSANGIGPITFAVGSDSAGFFTALIKPWNKAHPNQRVTLMLLPEAENGQLAQLTANLQAGSPIYDVIALDVVWTAEFASAGWIIPLESSLFPLGQFLRPAVDTAMYNGHLWAVPYYSNAEVLYYRKDILAKAGKAPPKTWAQLAADAKTVAPRYGLQGYATQLAPYEGLTVNFADALQSAGGSILSPGGTTVTVDSPQARDGLDFLVDGLQEGWIPQSSLSYEEESSWGDFESGKLLFLNNWPFIYSQASQPGPANKVYGQVGVAPLPGLDGPGSSSLGGANLAVSAFSRHQATAIAFIQYLTSLTEERQMLVDSGFPPVWTSLYSDPAMDKQFPYLPVVKQAILAAQPRPSIVDYDQASLAISSAVYQALTFKKTPQEALSEMATQLTQIIQDG